MGHSSYPRSAVLVLGQSSIYSLLPSTLFAQVESLLQNGRLAEAEALLERAEVDPAQGSTSSGYRVGGVRYSDLHVLTRNGQPEPLRYLHQCLAFAFVRQTRFREATTHFVKGAIDPRIPISYFDELRPALFCRPRDHEKAVTLRDSEDDSVEVEVWDGIREYAPEETSVDDISKLVPIFLFLLPCLHPVPAWKHHVPNRQSTSRQPIQLTLSPFLPMSLTILAPALSPAPNKIQ